MRRYDDIRRYAVKSPDGRALGTVSGFPDGSWDAVAPDGKTFHNLPTRKLGISRLQNHASKPTTGK